MPGLSKSETCVGCPACYIADGHCLYDDTPLTVIDQRTIRPSAACSTHGWRKRCEVELFGAEAVAELSEELTMTTQLVRSCPACGKLMVFRCLACERRAAGYKGLDKIGEERGRYPRRRVKREVER